MCIRDRGLAISKSIVDMMDGSIAVRSIKGIGTEFTVDVKVGITEEEKRRHCQKKVNLNLSLIHIFNFENTVICMTSNAGSSDRVGETGFAKTTEEMSRSKTLKALREFLRPEFLSRVDEVITFRPLDGEDLKKIAALMLDEYRQPLAAKGIGLSWTDEALGALCQDVYKRQVFWWAPWWRWGRAAWLRRNCRL